MAERREGSAATAQAAELCFDEGSAEAPIERVDEQPCAAIGHVHRTTGRRDRARFADQLEKADFAGADGAAARQVDPDGQSRYGIP